MESWRKWRKAVSGLAGAYAGAAFSIAVSLSAWDRISDRTEVLVACVLMTLAALLALTTYDPEGDVEDSWLGILININIAAIGFGVPSKSIEVSKALATGAGFFGFLAIAQVLEYAYVILSRRT